MEVCDEIRKPVVHTAENNKIIVKHPRNLSAPTAYSMSYTVNNLWSWDCSYSQNQKVNQQNGPMIYWAVSETLAVYLTSLTHNNNFKLESMNKLRIWKYCYIRPNVRNRKKQLNKKGEDMYHHWWYIFLAVFFKNSYIRIDLKLHLSSCCL